MILKTVVTNEISPKGPHIGIWANLGDLLYESHVKWEKGKTKWKLRIIRIEWHLKWVYLWCYSLCTWSAHCQRWSQWSPQCGTPWSNGDPHRHLGCVAHHRIRNHKSKPCLQICEMQLLAILLLQAWVPVLCSASIHKTNRDPFACLKLVLHSRLMDFSISTITSYNSVLKFLSSFRSKL